MTTKTALDLAPLSPAIGVEVRDVNIRDVDDDLFRDIEKAWSDHAVLLFRNQTLSKDDQTAFSRRFGPLQPAPNNTVGRPWLSDFPEIAVMSNIRENGAVIGSLGSGEAIWHSDMSYIDEPPSASLLYSLEIPDEGGDTGFANMYDAHDTLPDSLKSWIEGRAINHDASRDSSDGLRKGFDTVDDPRTAPGERHPIVRTHPVTGRKALFLGRRRNAWVVDSPLDESEALLDELWAHATQPSLHWHHKWAVGDLLVWDNRCTLHRRDSFDDKARRLLHRTQIRGDRPY
ncbi:MAG: TauD/TfdA family dioxygenase [Rhodospirillaceae bacterium]|nr:TauD/TfdA family dioxygenase [Rhodospirillaceae bacterium]MBT5664234.1 TauD/TfdA family dioxygenase [Rhodospirillaceae bacterium]